MPTPVTMPRLGESVAEGTIGAWLKKEGDYVEKDEALAEVITDKINAELPSPVEGRLSRILVQTDETVPVGTEIAWIEEGVGNAGDSGNSSNGQTARVEQTPEPVQNGKSAELVALPALESSQTPQFAYSHKNMNGNSTLRVSGQPQSDEEERQRISPLARRLAQEHGVDLNAISGTGTGGRVRKEDILAYVEQRAQPRAPQVAAASTIAAPAVVPQPVVASPVAQSTAGPDEELIVPSRMRLAIAEHMVRSKHTSPHATTVVEVDMTNIARWLEKNKEDFKRREGYGISYVPFVTKAVCEGLRKVPLMNSTWTADNKIIVKKRINLGLAVATDSGLVVPTIYDADQYTLAGLAKQINALAQRARANKLTLQDLQNSTFVVNNTGVFGTIISMPIINQPHAGIMSMDAVVKRAVVIEDDAIAVRSMMYICLSFDHRILDGAGAGAFLQTVRTKLQSYGREIDIY